MEASGPRGAGAGLQVTGSSTASRARARGEDQRAAPRRAATARSSPASSHRQILAISIPSFARCLIPSSAGVTREPAEDGSGCALCWLGVGRAGSLDGGVHGLAGTAQFDARHQHLGADAHDPHQHQRGRPWPGQRDHPGSQVDPLRGWCTAFALERALTATAGRHDGDGRRGWPSPGDACSADQRAAAGRCPSLACRVLRRGGSPEPRS